MRGTIWTCSLARDANHFELRKITDPREYCMQIEVTRTSRESCLHPVSYDIAALSSRASERQNGPYAALFRRTPPPSVSITLFRSLTQA